MVSGLRGMSRLSSPPSRPGRSGVGIFDGALLTGFYRLASHGLSLGLGYLQRQARLPNSFGSHQAVSLGILIRQGFWADTDGTPARPDRDRTRVLIFVGEKSGLGPPASGR